MSGVMICDDPNTPVLSADGQVFCSPACGFRCQKSAYDRAVKEADDLAAKLGPGWEPCVWENLGWHYRVTKGSATVYEERGGQWSAWLGFEGPRDISVQFIECAADPLDALGIATQKARTFIRRVNSELDDLYKGEGQS